MSKRAVDPFMGVEDQRISDRGWDSSLNAPLALLQPAGFPRCESTLSCETSDEETCHCDRQTQNEIDPWLGLQHQTHDASNSRRPVTSPALATQPTECGQQLPAANSRDRTGDSRPSKKPPLPEQLNEGVMPNVRHFYPTPFCVHHRHTHTNCLICFADFSSVQRKAVSVGRS
jgi:hypothetical protein